MPKSSDLLQGTLDMLILKTVSLGPLHGYGVLLRLQQISGNACRSSRARSTPRSTGSNTRASSGASGARRTTTAKPSIYSLTAAGRRRFQDEARNWERMADIVSSVLKTSQEER